VSRSGTFFSCVHVSRSGTFFCALCLGVFFGVHFVPRYTFNRRCQLSLHLWREANVLDGKGLQICTDADLYLVRGSYGGERAA
jgi:hypothetical protein